MKKAVSIKYTKDDLDVPVVSAMGYGAKADLIIQEALKNGIDVIANKDFFEFDTKIFTGEEIPEDVYKIVAEILAFVIKTNDEN